MTQQPPPHVAGQRARLRPRSFQVDQRPLRTRRRRRGPANVRQSGARNAARRATSSAAWAARNSSRCCRVRSAEAAIAAERVRTALAAASIVRGGQRSLRPSASGCRPARRRRRSMRSSLAPMTRSIGPRRTDATASRPPMRRSRPRLIRLRCAGVRRRAPRPEKRKVRRAQRRPGKLHRLRRCWKKVTPTAPWLASSVCSER